MSAKPVKNALSSVARSSAGLREALFDEIDALRNGTGNPTRANAVAKLSGTIVETVRIELEVERYAASQANLIVQPESIAAPVSPKPLALGL